MTRLHSALIVTATGLVYVAQLWMFQGFHTDDAYITFRYVQQWVHGNGLVYNIGERVEGYSNFLWVVMLAPFELIQVDLALAAKLLGCLLGLLTLTLTFQFGRRFSRGGMATLLLAASTPFVAWTWGQLETPLFAFLLLAAVYAFLHEEERRASGWSGVLFGLLALTRPEGLLFFGLAIAFRGWQLVHTGSRPESRDMVRLAACLAIVMPHLAWRFSYYGYPLPNTVYAKAMGLHPRAFLEGLVYLYSSLAVAGGWFFLALPVALALAGPARPRVAAYLTVNLAAYAAFVVAGGGDWMPAQRFLVHVLPFVYLLVQEGLLQVRQIAWPPGWGARVGTLLLAGQVAYLLAGSAEARFIDGVGQGPFLPPRAGAVGYLIEHTQPGDTIAVAQAGMIAYGVPLDARVVDVVGLADSHIAHLPVQLPGGLFGQGDGFGKWDIDYVLAQEPRFVQVNMSGISATGVYLTNYTGTNLLINDPRFRRSYELVQAPGVSGVFVRVDQAVE